MRRFVNGDEANLTSDGADVILLADRVMVRTPQGAFSALAVRQGASLLISYRGREYRVEDRPSPARQASTHGSGELRAPMPGQIVDVRFAEGDPVHKGQTVLVLEAMKTQQPFPAPFDGVVTRLPVKKGAQVTDGALLAIIEPLKQDHA